MFRAFAALRPRCPWQRFTALPTPVEHFPVEGVPDGTLYVKRDDRSCPEFGGNKPRRLEFIIGDALSRGARRLVTSGALGTHHGLATTVLGRRVGLATTVVLVPQPIDPDVRRNVLLLASYGADLVFGTSVPGATLRGLVALAAAACRGERPFVIPIAGASVQGSLGAVSAGFELAEQVREGQLPAPAEVWVPVGSGGTLAGLTVGLRLARLETRVVGVVISDVLVPSARRIARAASAAVRRLRALGAGVSDVTVTASDFDLVHDQVGPGYGLPTAAAQDAVAAAGRCGVQLETTYSGKALAALRCRVLLGGLRGRPLLFWNTFSSVDVLARAPRPPDVSLLPPRLRRALAAPA